MVFKHIKMAEKKDIITLIVFIILIIALLPVIFKLISTGENVYRCEDNASYTFLNGTSCMNTSGTPPSTEQYIEAEYFGLNATEILLLGLVSLFIIISGVVAITKTDKR